jgi:hypothetical protein
MVSSNSRWSKIDDAELLARVATGSDRAFAEFVHRYAMYVAALASRVLGTSPPTDLSVAVLSRVRTRASEAPKDPTMVRGWVLDLAFAISLAYKQGTYEDSAPIDEDERRSLAKQVEDNAHLFQQIEEYILHHSIEPAPSSKGRVGIARGRYRMTPAFDDPLPEFQEYE